MLDDAMLSLAGILNPTQSFSILEDPIQSAVILTNLLCSNALLVDPMGAWLSELCLLYVASLQYPFN